MSLRGYSTKTTNTPPKADIKEETNMGSKKNKKNDNKGEASTLPLQQAPKKEAEKPDAISPLPTTEVTAFKPEADENNSVVVPPENLKTDPIEELKPDDGVIPSIVIPNPAASHLSEKKASGTVTSDLMEFGAEAKHDIQPTSSVISTTPTSHAPKPTNEQPAVVTVSMPTNKFSVLDTLTASNPEEEAKDDEEIDAFGEFTVGSEKLDDNSQAKPSVIPTTFLEVEDTKQANQPSMEDLKELLQQLENVRQQQQLIIQRLSNENDSLRALQIQHLSQIENYDQSISDLKKEIQKLQAGIKERDQTPSVLNEQLIQSEEKIENVLRETTEIAMKNEQHDSVASEQRSTIEKLKRELNDLQQALSGTLTKEGVDPTALLTMQAALTNALSEIESLKNERDTAVQQNVTFTAKIEELSHELSTAQNEHETFVNASRAEYSGLQNELTKTQTSLEAVKANLTLVTALKDSTQQKQVATELSLSSVKREKAAKEREVAELNQTITQLRDNLATAQSQILTLSPSFLTNAIDRENRAKSAIATLEREIVVNSNSARDNALRDIVNHLNTGVAQADPQAYFEQNKEALRRNLQILNNWKSIANTALNVIITVLAFVSVVGITAAWLTGNLEKNAKNHGSQFAFLMFGDLQKGKRAVHEVSEAMTCRIGG